MKNRTRKEFPQHARKAVALAISLAFINPSWADEDDEILRLIKPESTISFGLGHVGTDNQRFGMYNGLNQAGTVALIDFSINRRDDESGTWFRVFGRNLGLDNRAFRIEHERQGHWDYFLDFDEITRHSPYTVMTNNQTIDANLQTIPTSSGTAGVRAGSTPYSLKTERQKVSVGLNGSLAALLPNLEFSLLFQNEHKEGVRLSGRGTGAFQEFLGEPIDSTTQQFDAVLNYTGENLQLSGGYYGSFYRNANTSLKVIGGNAAFNSGVGSTGVAMDNISLAPDNYSHQIHLAGGYQFTKLTRMSFKVSKSISIQEDDFMAVNFYNTANNGRNANTSGRTDLGGRVDATLVNLGLTSRPITGLFLLGSFRYEEREDKTAVARYISNVGGTGANPTITPFTATANPTNPTDGYNEPRSLVNRSAKLEASYLLPAGFQLTGGADIDQKERTMAGVRVVGYREKTDENTYRIEVKRNMADTLTGSLAYLHSNRDGSGYQNLVTLNGSNNYPYYGTTTANALRPCGQTIPARELQVTRCGLIQPIYTADRERDKVRIMLDWSPVDQLSAQVAIEGSNDAYGPGRGSPDIGVRQGDARLYSMDLVYTMNDRLKFTGWYSRSGSSIDQATIANPAAINPATLATNNANSGAVLWSSSQRNTVDTFGLGVRAKLPLRIDLGADYLFANDKTRYGMSRDAYAAFTTPAATAPGVLPDITYRQNTLRFFGTYGFDKDTKLRLDYVVDNRRIRDWTWSGYTYSDGTRIAANAEDTVHFVGISVHYAFR